VTDNVNGRYLRNPKERKLQTGTRTVLVIRAIASDASTSASEPMLSDAIFGTSGDVVNLKSQFAQCSDGKLHFQPLTTNTLVGNDGVYTVNISTAIVNGSKHTVIQEAMLAKAFIDLGGPLNSTADHVMLCMPRGTTLDTDVNWLGYAVLNNWLTVYNDDWCLSPSLQLHEIGKYFPKFSIIMNQNYALKNLLEQGII
jgi:hypothetical protein